MNCIFVVKQWLVVGFQRAVNITKTLSKVWIASQLRCYVKQKTIYLWSRYTAYKTVVTRIWTIVRTFVSYYPSDSLPVHWPKLVWLSLTFSHFRLQRILILQMTYHSQHRAQGEGFACFLVITHSILSISD